MNWTGKTDSIKKWNALIIFIFGIFNFGCSQNDNQRINKDSIEKSSKKDTEIMNLENLKLYERKGAELIEAPENDIKLAKTYPQWEKKGPEINGKRLTIMTEKLNYKTNENIRILHIVDYIFPGQDAFLMGPKKVYNEYVNDELTTEKLTTSAKDPLIPGFYDGIVAKSPIIDFNFDITTYKFSEKGIYKIQWKLDPYYSNILELYIEDE